MVVLVKEIMSKPVYVIDINKTAVDAGRLMEKHAIGALVVTKNKKPIGILTDSDIIRKVVVKNIRAASAKISSIMSTPLITIKPNETCLEAARKLKKNNIKRLPVVEEDGKIVGIVSLDDIAAVSPEMLDLLEYRLKMKEEPFEIKEKFTSGICDNCGNYFDHLVSVNDQWLCESCREESEE